MIRPVSIVSIFIALLCGTLAAAQVTSIVFCEDISEAEGSPIRASEAFNADAPQIKAIVTVGDCAAGTKVKGAWICVDGIDTPNYEIDAAEAVFEEAGGGLAYFALSRPDNGWPTGNYRLDVYIDEEPAESAPFSIGAGAGEQTTGTASSGDAVTAEKMEALEAAYRAGVLSEQEYNQKKAELLNETGTYNAAPSLSGGQVYQSPLGFSFWCPPGWSVKENNQKVELLPANKLSIGTVAAEMYYIYGVQGVSQPINDAYIGQYIEPQLQVLSPLLTSTGLPTQINNGTAQVYNWETKLLEDLQIILAARAYVKTTSNNSTILIGFGPKQILDARDSELREILDSVGSGNAPPGSPTSIMNSPTVQSSGFSGTYTSTSQNTTLTLTMNQDAQGIISGTLSSTTGAQYQMNGQVENGIAVGMCAGAEGAFYFEGQLQGNQLMLSLINVGADNMPDYSKTRQVVFLKNQAAGSPAQQMPQPTYPPQGTNQPTAAANATLGDASWGFSFAAPQGWQGQKTAQNVVLTNNNVAGSIVVFPHNVTSLQQVHANMQQGLIEQGVQLVPVTQVTNIGNSAVGADYAGTVNGQQMKARGIGTFNPNGGGAYIIALASPEQYSRQLAAAAETIAANMRYSQAQTSSLMQHFSGKWWTWSGNTTLDSTVTTEIKVYLGPDGRYYENYELTGGGEGRDEYGYQTHTWLLLNKQPETGRWTVRGTEQSGVMTFIDNDGSQESLEYQAIVENGRTFTNAYNIGGRKWFRGDPP